MGVKECNRSGCENILCDRLSDRFGYICNECFNELINSTKSCSTDEITNFMKTKKMEENELEFLKKVLENEFHDYSE